jgi:hypothetical protein
MMSETRVTWLGFAALAILVLCQSTGQTAWAQGDLPKTQIRENANGEDEYPDTVWSMAQSTILRGRKTNEGRKANEGRQGNEERKANATKWESDNFSIMLPKGWSVEWSNESEVYLTNGRDDNLSVGINVSVITKNTDLKTAATFFNEGLFKDPSPPELITQNKGYISTGTLNEYDVPGVMFCLDADVPSKFELFIVTGKLPDTNIPFIVYNFVTKK